MTPTIAFFAIMLFLLAALCVLWILSAVIVGARADNDANTYAERFPK